MIVRDGESGYLVERRDREVVRGRALARARRPGSAGPARDERRPARAAGSRGRGRRDGILEAFASVMACPDVRRARNVRSGGRPADGARQIARRPTGASVRGWSSRWPCSPRLYLGFLCYLSSRGVRFGALIVIAALMLGAQYFFSHKLAMWGMGAKEVTPEEAPELHAMVERLARDADPEAEGRDLEDADPERVRDRTQPEACRRRGDGRAARSVSSRTRSRPCSATRSIT